ncbi:MAG: hypothetical protein IKT82_04120 [Bacteroidaceae bacterium]|nr:hypothetical protein [Bacteroidaceae bacterium]
MLPLLMMAILCIMTLTSCKNENQAVKQLREIVNSAQSECPINAGVLGDLLDVRYLEEENVVKMYYNLNDGGFAIDAFNNNQELAKNNIKLACSIGDGRQLGDPIVKANARLMVVYKDAATGKTCEVSCSAEELKELQGKLYDETDMYEMLLQNQLSMENSRCPYAVDNGIMMTKVVDEDGFVVYYAELDEASVAPIRQIKQSESMKLMRQFIEEYFADPTVNKMVQMLTAIDRGVIYRYVGNKSGEKLDLVFTVEDLKAIGGAPTVDIE